MKKNKKILFRASSAHKLMIGGNEMTEKEVADLKELELRKAGVFLTPTGKVGSFSPKNKSDLDRLIKKKNAPFEFGDTAKTMIKQMWLYDQYNYKDIVITDELIKGNYCEEDAIGLVSNLIPEKEYRIQNNERFSNDFFQGKPDVLLKSIDLVEDQKTCFDKRTFMNTTSLNPLYYGQGQVYMDLTGLNRFRVNYCLVTTPEVLRFKMLKKYYYKLLFGKDENGDDRLDPIYEEIVEQIEANHSVEDVPFEKRLKSFEFEKDEKYLSKLKDRVLKARKYYNTLSIDMIDKNWKLNLQF